VSAELAATLNGDCHAAPVDRAALERALRAEGEEFFRYVTEHCPHLFASAAYFISAAQAAQMREVIAAVEQVASLSAWRAEVLKRAPAMPLHALQAKGVFMGYDFHLNADGAHLIEINTNAGGAFLNNLLLHSQRDAALPGEAAAADNLEQAFLAMFRDEWRLANGDAPLRTVAIVDERPQQQYLYPEFVLAQRMFERAGIAALIADPSELEAYAGSLYCTGQKIDLVYNRLTDFYLQQHIALYTCFQNNELTVITPHPLNYALYADKYNLTWLTCGDSLRAMGVPDAIVAVLQAGIPQVKTVRQEQRELWWEQRKQWFFKPASGFGSRGGYRGASVTHRVFDEIMLGGYVAQRMALPGERSVCGEGGESALKADVRCYTYNGCVQLIAARLYQGQTTNFRTANGGFAQVRILG
jgi:hypothetical protein